MVGSPLSFTSNITSASPHSSGATLNFYPNHTAHHPIPRQIVVTGESHASQLAGRAFQPRNAVASLVGVMWMHIAFLQEPGTMEHHVGAHTIIPGPDEKKQAA